MKQLCLTTFQILTGLLAFSAVSCNFSNTIKNDTCEYKTRNCASLVKDAFDKLPNHREKRTPDLITMHGYPVEIHEVTTKDGYILTVYRIPYYNQSTDVRNKVPVFLMHGGQASSAQWFWQPAHRSLVFMLANGGYDVWIGNARGTSYSQKHLSLSTSDPKYWDFSQHEYGKYDFPALVNYITNQSSQPSLYYIGHSLGVAQFFVGITLNPELRSKIRTIFALAPAVYVGNVTNPAFKAIANVYSRYSVVNARGHGRFIPESISKIFAPISEICRISWVNCGLCGNLAHLISGYSCQLNITALPGLMAHIPDVTSSKTESHFAQWIQTGEFKEYDFGNPTLNLQHYGTPSPAFYNWTNVDVPVVIYYSDGDDITTTKDALKLAAALGSNVKELNKVPIQHFRHIDYVVGIDADELIYNKILRTMDTQLYDGK